MIIISQEASAIGALTLASASGASSYFGWFNFVNSNAPGVGVFLSLIFGMIGVYFMFNASNKQEKAEVNEKKIESVKSDVTHLKSDMAKVKSGVEQILVKINDA